MPYNKDSFVLVVRGGIGGYSTSYYRFKQTPPPAESELRRLLESSAIVYRREGAHDTKNKLKDEITKYINEKFDIDPPPVDEPVPDETFHDEISTDPV